MNTPDILQKIIQRKGEIVDARRVQTPLEQLMESVSAMEPPRPFVEALLERIELNQAAHPAQGDARLPVRLGHRERLGPARGDAAGPV